MSNGACVSRLGKEQDGLPSTCTHGPSSFLLLLPTLERAAWRFPNVRAFNEVSLRPRVARARGIARLPFFSFFSLYSSFLVLEGVAKVALDCAQLFHPPNPERAETRSCPRRAQFLRARSASKEDAWPLLFSFPPHILKGGQTGYLSGHQGLVESAVAEPERPVIDRWRRCSQVHSSVAWNGTSCAA